MSTPAAGGGAVRVERRRSTRLPIRVALVVCGEAGRFQEHTCTSSLNAHGALLALAASVTIGQKLAIQNPENWAERDGRVTRLGPCYAGRTEVGVEFTEAVPDFWLIPSNYQGDKYLRTPNTNSGET
jgi:hypothetical protein